MHLSSVNMAVWPKTTKKNLFQTNLLAPQVPIR